MGHLACSPLPAMPWRGSHPGETHILTGIPVGTSLTEMRGRWGPYGDASRMRAAEDAPGGTVRIEGDLPQSSRTFTRGDAEAARPLGGVAVAASIGRAPPAPPSAAFCSPPARVPARQCGAGGAGRQPQPQPGPSAAQRSGDMEAASAEPCSPGPPPPPLPEKKKLQRAPSPARPKEVPGWSLARSRRGGSAHSAAASRLSAGGGSGHPRRAGGGKEPRPEKRQRAAAAAARGGGRGGAAGRGAARAKGRCRGAEPAAGALRPGPGPGPGPGQGCGLTDSSSEVSDCSASEEAKLMSLELSGSDSESPGSAPPPPPSAGEASPLPEEPSAASMASSRLQLSTSLAFSDLTEELLDAGTDGLLRELEDLRSENDYLKVGTVRHHRVRRPWASLGRAQHPTASLGATQSGSPRQSAASLGMAWHPWAGHGIPGRAQLSISGRGVAGHGISSLGTSHDMSPLSRGQRLWASHSILVRSIVQHFWASLHVTQHFCAHCTCSLGMAFLGTEYLGILGQGTASLGIRWHPLVIVCLSTSGHPWASLSRTQHL